MSRFLVTCWWDWGIYDIFLQAYTYHFPSHESQTEGERLQCCVCISLPNIGWNTDQPDSELGGVPTPQPPSTTKYSLKRHQVLFCLVEQWQKLSYMSCSRRGNHNTEQSTQTPCKWMGRASYVIIECQV